MLKVTFLLAMIIPGTIFAQTSFGRKLQTKSFPKTSTCGVTKFSLATFDVGFKDFGGKPGQTRASMMSAVWDTSDASCATKYGVVQYIRGCIFSTIYDPATGEENNYFELMRESRGNNIDFQHKVWEVDSLDIDPMYSSYSEPDANEANRSNWNKVTKKPFTLKGDAASLKKAEETYLNGKNYTYIMNVPSTKQVFVTDVPSGSDYNPAGPFGKHWVQRSSLEFKTCLYKVSDIPMTGDPKDPSVSASEGGPIVCFEWSDKSKPDYAKKTLVRTEEMEPFCLQ